MQRRTLACGCAVLLACGSGVAPADGGPSRDGGRVDARIGVDAPPTDGGSAATGQWVMGYYTGYAPADQYPVADIDWSGLTHIIVTRFTVTASLGIDTTFDRDATGGPAFANEIVGAAHAHGVQALVMLGGEGAGANIRTAASAPNRDAFVAALLTETNRFGFDGIDLDWEDFVELADLVALAQALRAAQPDIVLTFPGGMINGNFQSVDPLLVTLADSLDAFNVQAYGGSTAFAGSGWASWHDSPLSGVTGSTPIAIDDTLQRYVDAGIDRAKLGMGVGFFAECWTDGITAPNQPTRDGTTEIVGGDNQFPLSAMFAPGSALDLHPDARIFDPNAMVPYLSLPAGVSDAHCGQAAQYISYDDEESIRAKGAFSRTQGYGGIIVWTINQGWLDDGSIGGRSRNALMQALREGFLAP